MLEPGALMFAMVSERESRRGRRTLFFRTALWTGTCLVASAAHWLVPRSEDTLPIWIALAFDAVALVATLWTAVELGCLEARPEKRL